MIKKIIFLLAFMPTFIFAGYKDILVRKSGEIIQCTITKEDSIYVYIDLEQDGRFISSKAAKNTLQEIHYDDSKKLKKKQKSKKVMADADTSLIRKNRLKVELNFNPFGDEVFSFEHIQFKYVLNDKTALRCGVKLNYKANNQDENDYDSDAEYPGEVKERAVLWGIKPGIEFKLLQNTKLVPYGGFEVFFYDNISWAEYTTYEYNGSFSDYNREKVKTEINGGWKGTAPTEFYYNGNTYKSTMTVYGIERGFLMFGANAFLGADYYFTPNLYLGLELGLGYEFKKYKQVEMKNLTSNDETIMPSYSETKLGLYCNSAFRIGICF